MAGARRILFFVHDGGGLGHLRRISRIAAALQEDAACLVVCGHRPAAWIVPEGCEYMHVPSLDSLIDWRAAHWGRPPFTQMRFAEAMLFRRRLINSIVELYAPGVVVVDYLPLGKFGELADVVTKAPAEKVFVMRGVMDEPSVLAEKVFDPEGLGALERHYRRILVACDRRIAGPPEESGLSPAAAAKLVPIGYVSDEVPPAAAAEARRRRGLPPGGKWVVCSAGSGWKTEALTEECVRLSRACPEAAFDIVAGPRSRLALPPADSGGRVNVVAECRELPLLHAAADVVVTAGGYNSLVESLEGAADVIVAPAFADNAFEQRTHAERLAAFVPLTVVPGPAGIEEALRRSLGRPASGPRPRGRERLDFDGARQARDQILPLAREARPFRDGAGADFRL